jgi:hypothetical protein
VAIAWRLARASRNVIIGSRKADAAQKKAAELGHGLRGMGNAEAAAVAELVIVTVPFAAQQGTLTDIKPHVAGKIVVDTTVPLMPPKMMRVQLPAEGSAAVRAEGLLGEVLSQQQIMPVADGSELSRHWREWAARAARPGASRRPVPVNLSVLSGRLGAAKLVRERRRLLPGDDVKVTVNSGNEVCRRRTFISINVYRPLIDRDNEGTTEIVVRRVDPRMRSHVGKTQETQLVLRFAQEIGTLCAGPPLFR